jgi:hypothetical protein
MGRDSGNSGPDSGRKQTLFCTGQVVALPATAVAGFILRYLAIGGPRIEPVSEGRGFSRAVKVGSLGGFSR